MVRFENVERDIHCIPTLAETIRTFAAAKRRKACGPDSLPGELFAKFPAELARVLHPVGVKAAATI